APTPTAPASGRDAARRPRSRREARRGWAPPVLIGAGTAYLSGTGCPGRPRDERVAPGQRLGRGEGLGRGPRARRGPQAERSVLVMPTVASVQHMAPRTAAGEEAVSVE